MCAENVISDATLDALVVAACADYKRRSALIDAGVASRRTDAELRYLNYQLLTAAAEIVGYSQSEIYIHEIGARIGYAYSALDSVSETTYKNHKKLIKRQIARKLHLCD